MEENKTGIPFPAGTGADTDTGTDTGTGTDTDHLVSQLNPDECSAILRAIDETYFIGQPQRFQDSKVIDSWYHEELKANQTQLDQTVMEYLNKAETFRIEYEESAVFCSKRDMI